MGSMARRGGDGVRYRGGRPPRWLRKDVALAISALTDGIEDTSRRKADGGETGCRIGGGWEAGGRSTTRVRERPPRATGESFLIGSQAHDKRRVGDDAG